MRLLYAARAGDLRAVKGWIARDAFLDGVDAVRCQDDVATKLSALLFTVTCAPERHCLSPALVSPHAW
jgi:hypothetical protein